MYLHSQPADALPWGSCSASPALPSSFETLPVPLAAETQGAELTSKLKQTLTMAQTPAITCHALAFSVSDAYYFFLSDNSTFDGSLQAG